jgi:ribosome-associated toxin RatA of RatAB toxin-antitoxin module
LIVAAAVTGRSRRSWLIMPAVWLSLLAGPAIAQNAQLEFRTTREGERFIIEATAEIEATVADAWKVLTDYDRLAEFIPGVRESRVMSRQGSLAVIELHGEASWLFFTFPMRVRLAIEEFPYDRIESTAIGGDFREMHGVYFLRAIPGGTNLHYEGTFTPDFRVPPLIGTLLMRSRLEKRFRALVSEIAKQRASLRP